MKDTRNDKLSLYEKLIAKAPAATLKGKTMPYTSVNGHMYSYFTKDDYLALRLPEAERAEFIRKYDSKLVEQYGVIQKEYVVVPDRLLAKTDELAPYFKASHKYVSDLKPKATKKK